LKQYLPAAPKQTFADSPFLKAFEPSPWEAFTFSVTNGLLNAGKKAVYLREETLNTITEYVETCASLARASANLSTNGEVDGDPDDSQPLPPGLTQIIRLAVSLLGFLDAATQNADFFNDVERMRLIMMIRDLLSDKFMTALETALSTLRNSKTSGWEAKEWRSWVKHYASLRRPLGAMLLRQSYMALVSASAGLLVATPMTLSRGDILDTLQSKSELDATQDMPSNLEVVESLAEIVAEEYDMLEAGSDYLQLGSAWQHRLAFQLKAYILRSFLCCSILEEEAADPDLLLNWLESTLVDPVQMADEVLASVVLRSLAVLAQTSHNLAAKLSRSLPRHIVRGRFHTQLAPVAASTLSSILSVLPEDTTITTLYSLGNELSANPGADRIGASPLDSSPTKGNHGANGVDKQPLIDFEEPDHTSAVHATIIQTIVGVARRSKDEKMIALAQSMLVQKISRNNAAIDGKILTEVASLSIYGGTLEFRSLLKLYSRIAHDALVRRNLILLTSV
jgi:phosphatidylinositol 4-kinase A